MQARCFTCTLEAPFVRSAQSVDVRHGWSVRMMVLVDRTLEKDWQHPLSPRHHRRAQADEMNRCGERGWEAGIRTPINRSRVCRVTVTLPPSRKAGCSSV